MTSSTYKITRWRKTPTGEEWYTVRGGYTRARAEELVAMAKLDPRTAMASFRVEEE